MRIIERIFFAIKSNERNQLLLASGIFYLSLFVNLNNKTLVLLFFIYWLFLSLICKDFKKALFFAYLASFPIMVGKTYEVNIITLDSTFLIGRPEGIINMIVITIREIFAFLMVFFLVREKVVNKIKVFYLDKELLLLIVFFICLVVSSIFGSLRPEISLIHSLYFLEPVILYLYLGFLLRYSKGKDKLLFSSLIILSLSVLFVFTITLLQFLHRGTLGFSVEVSQEFLPLSLGVDEDIFQFRPLATFKHANEVAQFILPFIFMFIPWFITGLKNFRQLFSLTFFAGAVTLLLSSSRSAWFSFFISLLLILFVLEKKWQVKITISKLQIKLFFLLLPVFLVIFGIHFLPRLINTFHAFEIYGGGYTRFKLIKNSLELFNQSPLLGVGYGMEAVASYLRFGRNSNNLVSSFPEGSHNFYVSLLSETGIITFTIYLSIIFLFLKRLLKVIKETESKDGKILLLGLFLGLSSVFLNNLLQPYMPDLQLFLISVMLYSDRKQLKYL